MSKALINLLRISIGNAFLILGLERNVVCILNKSVGKTFTILIAFFLRRKYIGIYLFIKVPATHCGVISCPGNVACCQCKNVVQGRT